MDYARRVHPYKFDHNKQKFNDTAFKKSSGGGGMSLISVDCAGNKADHSARILIDIAKGKEANPCILSDASIRTPDRLSTREGYFFGGTQIAILMPAKTFRAPQ